MASRLHADRSRASLSKPSRRNYNGGGRGNLRRKFRGERLELLDQRGGIRIVDRCNRDRVAQFRNS
jgi:hypothetical protein